MEQTFFILFETSPEPGSVIDPRIEGALAHCWIVESDARSAMMKASYKVRQSGWRIDKVNTPPVVVTRDDHAGKDWGLKCFDQCQIDRLALAFVGHSKAVDLHSDEPKSAPKVADINLSEWLLDQKRIKDAGKCLFYDAAEYCNEVIDAHSIQRGQALSSIAVDGYVYHPSLSFGDVKKSKGKVSFARTHINSFSTFRGLCKIHDNLVFRSIDDQPLKPTDQQAFLYAYRSILKELSAKNFAAESLRSQLSRFQGSTATKAFLEISLEGTSWGQHYVQREKSRFDESYRQGTHSDIRYVLFRSASEPTVAFSGGFFPDWGFNGEPIQDLTDLTTDRGAITFSFAPTENGWGFLFAWHKCSDEVCRYFISTLQRSIREGRNLGNLLFQLVVKGCENTAFSPTWIEALSDERKSQLIEAMSFGSDLLKAPDESYLTGGIEAPPGWEFNAVEDNLERLWEIN